MDSVSRSRSNLSGDELLRVMGRITVHDFCGNRIRTLFENKVCWFVCADICRALGYKNPNDIAAKLRKEEKAKLDIGLKNTLAVCVNISGVYSVTLCSHKPLAEKLQKWAAATAMLN